VSIPARTIHLDDTFLLDALRRVQRPELVPAPEPRGPDRLTVMRATHYMEPGQAWCHEDHQWWPCDTAIALAALDEANGRLR